MPAREEEPREGEDAREEEPGEPEQEPGEGEDAREEEPGEAEQEPGEAPPALDRLAELEALLALGRRAPGSDAERRTSLHLKQRLEALGRSAELESFSAYPSWPLAYALLAAAGVGASVLAVYAPAGGAALALAALLLTVLDAGLLLPLVRRPLGRRASQNVVSWDNDEAKPGALVLVAHVDAPRAGLASSARLEPLLAALLAVLVCAVLRLAGLEGTALTVIQLLPTAALIVAVALLVDIALAGTRAGENDNTSGCVLALALAERATTEHFGVHVLFTGAQHAGCAGMRDFLKRHSNRLPRERTVFVNLDAVGSGAVRYTRREGPLATARSHVQLLDLADQIVEDGFDASSLVTRRPSDGAAAAAAGFAALTVTCSDPASGRVTEVSLDNVAAFTTELVARLDAEIGPRLGA
jgi:hypothetical protein